MNLLQFKSSSILKLVFVFAVFILLFISSVSYKHNKDTHETSKLVIHTHEINVQLERLISSVKDAEIGQNGYIITKNKLHLTPYTFSRDKVNSSFILLRKLTADSPIQQKNLKEIYVLITKRYKCFEESLKFGSEEHYDQKKLDNSLLRGRVLMANIRFKADQMKDIEKKHLEEREANYENEISLTPLFTISVFLVALILIILSYRQINRDILRLQVSNKKLTISNRLIFDAEKIGKFCTWQWDLNTDAINFSDNQFQMLGFKPNAFVPEKNTFINFVHPDDKELVINGLKEIKENKKLPITFYRIIRQDGTVLQIKSIARLLNMSDEKNKVILGISFDVTNEYEQNLVLKERNKELENTNQELASFNHVASHDLQEPLRKIQTFISRIPAADREIISTRSREYLDKIDSSSKRMRVLIDDLLLFSKTNTNKKEFLKSDLNELLENAKHELAEVIADKKALIENEPLPKLKVIPYQIEQLFINIIGNSIKYSRTNVAPQIMIGCTKILAEKHPELLNQRVKKYYKITFTDNGMGFDPEFKKSIFVLFKRLHSKNEYPGTGIGLAICKKIAENHEGNIIADSEPGKGSIFTLYLPE